ncbi:MAG: TetR/AcrR family transcriptional regulator, partial [Deltaproteobacteria bacterium]|nr:TetR/AcrR family transcriptional regulator [Deltaproteobacteria bacterium]
MWDRILPLDTLTPMDETDEGTRTWTERDRQREETRRKVYEAALEVFRRDGVEKARIDEIARVAGVSRGTFYFHFHTKDDVLLELVHESETKLCDRMEAMPEDAPILEVLDAIAEHIAAQWSGDPQLLRDIGVVSFRNIARSMDEEREAHPARVALVPRIRSAIARNEVSGLLPAEITSDFFLVNLFGAAVAWVGNP